MRLQLLTRGRLNGPAKDIRWLMKIMRETKENGRKLSPQTRENGQNPSKRQFLTISKNDPKRPKMTFSGKSVHCNIVPIGLN